MRVARLLAALIVPMFFASTALAAVSPEVCGDGIDDPLQTGGSANGTKGSCPAGYMDSVIGNGCDKKCPGVDQDDDGYNSDGSTGTSGSTNIDCDDTDRTIYPGVYTTKGCSGGQYHKCQNDGTYTACTSTTLCEATGTGVCKYIDCTAGNDANSGTYASPYKTLGKISGGSGASGLPASPYTLQPDDVAYIIGGTCNTTITCSGASGLAATAVLAEINVSGTSGHPITIKEYPGAGATLTNTNGPGIIGAGSYVNLSGSGLGALLDISTQRSTAGNAMGVFFNASSSHHGDGLYIHDTQMHGDNNDACWLLEHGNDGQITHSFFYKCKRNTGNVDNDSAITWLDNHDTANECQNHMAAWNTVWWDAEDDTNGGDCFKEKHGCNAADVGANKHVIKYNTCINGRRAFHLEGSSIRFSNNVVVGTPNIFYLIGAGGTDNTKQEDNELTNNLYYGSTLLQWSVPTFLATTQHFKVDSNIFVDTLMSAYTVNDGLISLAGYGSDANLSTTELNAQLVLNNNCYYNATTAVKINYFGQTSGGWGPAGPAGALYSLTGWQALTPGYDANSYEENPTLDSYLRPTSTHCAGRGRSYSTAVTPVLNPASGQYRNRYSTVYR